MVIYATTKQYRRLAHVAREEFLETLELEDQLIYQIRRRIHWHYCAPNTLATGGTTLAHKFHAVMHSLFLEAGSSFQDLCGFAPRSWSERMTWGQSLLCRPFEIFQSPTFSLGWQRRALIMMIGL